MGGVASTWRGGPDQLWPGRPGVGCALGGAAHCQGGHKQRLPYRYRWAHWREDDACMCECVCLLVLRLICPAIQVPRGQWWSLPALMWELHT